MLSYQHIYHAGNPADVHKHALLAWMLAYLTQKRKPLSYLETHSGRGIYDLSSAAATRTGEAAAGILRAEAEGWFAPDHPYMRALEGQVGYPGSPRIAAALLRDGDRMHLAELHPREYEALREAMRGTGAKLYHQDGLDMAQSVCPPEPRRGLMMIDPSWEVKTEYQTIPTAMKKLAAKWNVGVFALWYPLLGDGRHRAMLKTLEADFPDALRSEVRFPPVREGHGMLGSGMFIVNPPWGLDAEAARVAALFSRQG